MTQLTRLYGLAGLALVVALAPLSSQTIVTRSSDGLVTVEATALPLRTVLLAMTAIEPIDIRLDPKVADRAVTIRLENVRGLFAIARVLDASGVDYVMSFGPVAEGSKLVVTAGDLKSAIPLHATADPDDPPDAPAAAPVAEEPEKSEDPDDDEEENTQGGVVGLGAAATGPVPGSLTAAQILQLITPPGGRPLEHGLVQLPFFDANGKPITMMRTGGRRSVVALPFPDATGQQLMQPIPPQTVPPGFVALPFPGPDGNQLLVPIQPTTPPAPPAPPKGTSTPGQVKPPVP